MFVVLSGRRIRSRIIVMLCGIVALLAMQFVFPDWAVRSIATIANMNRLVPIYGVEKEEKIVALSFDAAWGADYTADLLATLKEHDIKATFFLVGFWVEKYPEVARAISEAGHEIGNHSSTHPHMSQLDVEQIKFELSHTHDLILETTGQEANLFRPPFGDYNNRLIETLELLNYHAIQWSVDSLDWRESMSRDDIVSRVVSKVHPGAIILFHNNATHTPAALEPIIVQLKEKGYSFTTIGDLLLKEDWYIDKSNGMQRAK